MNSIEKDFNIKENNQYIIIMNDFQRIQGQILDFNTAGKVVIKTDKGLYIKQYTDIKEMFPINYLEESFNKIKDKDIDIPVYKVGSILKSEEKIIGISGEINKNEICKIEEIGEDDILLRIIITHQIVVINKKMINKFSLIEFKNYKVGDEISLKDSVVEKIMSSGMSGGEITLMTASIYRNHIHGEIYKIDKDYIYIKSLDNDEVYRIEKIRLI